MNSMCVVNKEKKIIILTGAYKNIGAMLLKTLVSYYTVWPVCRTREQAEELERLFSNYDLRCFFGDLCDQFVIDELDKASRSVSLHALIHCVGPVRYSDEAVPAWNSWSELYEANMKSSVNLLRVLAPRMKSGRIIFFGFSGNGTSTSFKQIAAYAAAKEAIVVLARSAAREYAETGTTVNVVAPGVFKMSNGEVPFKGAELLKRIPMARFGESEDITGVVKWILGPGSAYVTGQIIKVSGGLHIS